MAVTTIVRSWNDCNVLEQMQRRYLKIRVSVVFTTGHMVFLVHLTCIFVSSLILLPAFFVRTSTFSSEQAMESPSSSVSTLSNFRESFALNMWNLPSGIALGCNQKKTLLRLDPGVDNVLGVPKTCALSQCCYR